MIERKLTTAEVLLERISSAQTSFAVDPGGPTGPIEGLMAIEAWIADYFKAHPRVVPENPPPRKYAALVTMVHVSAIAYAKAALKYATVSLAPLHCAMLRLAAARLRKTGEDGAAEWAQRLERMANDEPYLAPDPEED